MVDRRLCLPGDRLMWHAKILIGQKPFVTRYQSTEVETRSVMTADGWVDKCFVVPTRPRAWLFNGGAAAISHTPHGAIASAAVKLQESEMKAEIEAKRDRA